MPRRNGDPLPVVAIAVACTLLCAAAEHPVVVVVSFDGFKPDYMSPDTTPNMIRFRNASAAPPYMRPAFPTKTFVNHFSMATGLHPEAHGVLDNYMFDENANKMHYTYEQFHYDDSVVPIWMLNEYNGNGRHSGVMMWPGSEFNYQGHKPTHIQIYNKTIPWTSRVDKIISWIKDEKQPANLVFAYFEEPDATSHLKGIESQDVKNEIVRVDTTVKYIVEKIKSENLDNKINLIILSDHGMETVTHDKIIYIDDYISNDTKKIVNGPNAFIYPNPDVYDEIYNSLSKESTASGRFNVYKKEELPERWHIKNTTRLNGIIYLLANPGYVFYYNLINHILKNITAENFRTGSHGYDNDDPNMQALFMASGPAFKSNFTAQPFDNIDLYPLISEVLHLRHTANMVSPDGTIEGVQQLLLSTETSAASGSRRQVQVIMLAALLLHTIARPP